MFVAYFLFQHLIMNSIYLPIDSESRKTKARSCFYQYVARVVLFFHQKSLMSYKMILPASNSLKVLEMVENELEKTVLKISKSYGNET